MLLKTLAALTFGLSLCTTALAAATDIQLDNGGILKGTLERPAAIGAGPVVLLLSGSGPIDRNGNGPGTPNDSLQQLAQALAAQGIASVRYDKRGIAASAAAAPREADMTIERYVDDAAAWLALLKADTRFNKVVVVGHSEGALIGLLAANRVGASSYVSLEGAGERASVALRRQLAGKLPPDLQQENERILVALEQGKLPGAVPAALNTLYRPSVQPYLVSWFKYDPAAEIAKLNIPARIIQGDSDLQVTVADARKLEQSRPGTPVVIIPGMNHVLKLAQGDVQAQMKAYTTPDLPVAPQLVAALVEFVNKK